jgi:Na+-driven multidrug efflux pump
MYWMLSAAAAVVAVTVAGFGVFAAYLIGSGKRPELRSALQRWTVFDYVILTLFVISSLFLLADLVGVMRDREAYPYYHYGYLLSGFVYHLLSGLFLFVRLGVTFRLGGASAANDNHREPDQA